MTFYVFLEMLHRFSRTLVLSVNQHQMIEITLQLEASILRNTSAHCTEIHQDDARSNWCCGIACTVNGAVCELVTAEDIEV